MASTPTFVASSPIPEVPPVTMICFCCKDLGTLEALKVPSLGFTADILTAAAIVLSGCATKAVYYFRVGAGDMKPA